MRDEFNARKSQWENEKNAIGKVQELRKQIDQANDRIWSWLSAATTTKRPAPFSTARLPQLQKQLEAEEQLAAQGKQSSLLRNARHRGGDCPHR